MAEEAKAAEKAELSFWRSLFDDISIAQLLAGALAAVTSMLLASRIGIAGSGDRRRGRLDRLGRRVAGV